MRINKFVAQATGLSRRAADQAISQGRVTLNQRAAGLGDEVQPQDQVSLDGRIIEAASDHLTIMLNKPAGYVCSRRGQGSRTIYDLLPTQYHRLKPVGRLDKDSSGLLLMTDDGELANLLTHPRYAKLKVYQVRLNKPLEPFHQQMINDHGIRLDDGLSRLKLSLLSDDRQAWLVSLSEGRNRQIRRTFAALGYSVQKLHRTQFGNYQLAGLRSARFSQLPD